MSAIKYMQMILNKKEKEELVVELHREGKTIREIASKLMMVILT